MPTGINSKMKNQLQMKIKILFFTLLAVTLFSCDELPDGVVNSLNSQYQVSEISAPDYVVFNQLDSSIVATLKIDNTEVISQVWYDVLTSNGSEVIISNAEMFDNGDKLNYGDQISGDKIFSGKTYFGKSKSSGKYLLRFYAKDNVNNEDENTRVVGFHQFEFDNGQNKFAPVISDLVMPDTVGRGSANVFVFTVKVTDGNGLKDIDQVYFKFIRPDNSVSGTILMVDNGDANLGDAVAGDGIYSFKNSFSDGSTSDPAQTGNWTFIFQAKDKSNLLSNEITHTIFVKE